MRPLILKALVGCCVCASAASGRSAEGPNAQSLGSALYPDYTASSGRTGLRGEACGVAGERVAHLIATKKWFGLGREMYVAAFEWSVVDPETDRTMEYSQACGPLQCEIGLFSVKSGQVRAVARGVVDSCSKLDLAPYRMNSKETLIGVRGGWVNHGDGEITLTLMRVSGESLVPAATIPLVVFQANEMPPDEAVVSMTPGPSEIASIRVVYPPSEGQAGKVREYRWQGDRYVQR